MAKEMNEPVPTLEFSESYLQCLCSSAESFRKGEDHNGLEMFLKGLENLEKILCMRDFDMNSEEMNSIVCEYKNLLSHMRNRDILGITDILEYTLYPVSEKWLKGVGQ